MITTKPGIMLCAMLMGLCGWAGAASVTAQSPLRVDRRALEEVADRNERDTADKLRAIAVCGSGFVTQEVPDAAVACNTAYMHTLSGGDYNQAMRHAVQACEKYQHIGLCRRAGGLPLLLGNQGIAIPAEFKAEIKRAASAVCYSGKRYRAINSVDVTARECDYFARQFGLAKDPEYTPAMELPAMRFFESLYEPQYAAKLYAVSCERLGSRHGCQQASALQAGMARTQNVVNRASAVQSQ